MQTTIALPSIASSRRSKCWTKSSAIRRIRFSLPTSASSAAHLVLSFSLRPSSSPVGDLLELGIDLGQLGFVQAQIGGAAFVVDRHRGLADDGLRDVVDRGHVQRLATSLHTNLRGDLNLILQDLVEADCFIRVFE